MLIRRRAPADDEAVAAFLRAHNAVRVARLGALLDALDHPALVALSGDGSLAGVLTYVVDGPSCEILTLHAAARWRGTGTALVAEARRLARAAGCAHLWLVTTNDNVDGLRFYQRRGFRLTALHPGAVDTSRATLKPEIPPTGAHGIPLRDELVLTLAVGLGEDAPAEPVTG